MNDSTAEGQRILALLLERPSEGPRVANDLLRCFHRGFPLHNLLRLLESEDQELIRVGVWIQSELGAAARPFLRFLPRFLRNEQKSVLFFALDPVITCAMQDAALVAAAARLIDDPEEAIRQKTIKLLAALPEGVLRSVLLNEPERKLRRGLQSLVGGEDAHEQARDLLQSEDAILRRFGVAAALRYENADLLRLAAASEDSEVGEIAREGLATREQDG